MFVPFQLYIDCSYKRTSPPLQKKTPKFLRKVVLPIIDNFTYRDILQKIYLNKYQPLPYSYSYELTQTISFEIQHYVLTLDFPYLSVNQYRHDNLFNALMISLSRQLCSQSKYRDTQQTYRQTISWTRQGMCLP